MTETSVVENSFLHEHLTGSTILTRITQTMVNSCEKKRYGMNCQVQVITQI